MHIDGNILLSDLEGLVPEALLTKLKLIYFGDQPLYHEQESELVEKMLDNAGKLFQVLFNVGFPHHHTTTYPESIFQSRSGSFIPDLSLCIH